MEEILTKKQRHEVYKIALKYYKKYLSETDESEILAGMCDMMENAIYELGFENTVNISAYTYKNTLKALPEFYALKPSDRSTDGYWWPANDVQKRLDNFNLLIEQTKES